MTQISDTEWQVSVQALPEKGDANKAIIKLLARHFSVPQSAIKILRGSSARKKLIQLG